MTKEEFKKLKTGDMVQITTHGKNRGKIGIVKRIRRDYKDWETLPRVYQGGGVYLEPFNQKFEFSKNSSRKPDAAGLYYWDHANVGFAVEDCEKEFYVAAKFGEIGISWPTTNFNMKELVVIQRFLTELNDHAGAITIEAIVIMDVD
jgi:hypothetical protein